MRGRRRRAGAAAPDRRRAGTTRGARDLPDMRRGAARQDVALQLLLGNASREEQRVDWHHERLPALRRGLRARALC